MNRLKVWSFLSCFLVISGFGFSQNIVKDSIQSGDIVLLTVNGEPSISGQFPVSLSGDISHPLLGQIKVIGENSESLAKKVIDLLKPDYILSPALSVALTNKKPFSIRLIGEVSNPGNINYPREDPMDLGSAIGLVGNMTIDANKAAITLRRGGKMTQLQMPSSSLFLLQNGDVINIPKLPELGQFSIQGEVVKAGNYPVPRNGRLSIFAAINMASGPTKVAKLQRIKVSRRNSEGKVISIRVDSTNRSKEFNVLPGDEIEVPAKLF